MALENDEIRRTNVERRSKHECANDSDHGAAFAFVIRFRNSFVICHSQRSASIGSTLRSELLHMNASATGAEDHWFATAIDRAFEMVASDFAADRYRQVAGHPAAGRGGVEIERGILREMHGHPAAGCSQFHFIGQRR